MTILPASKCMHNWALQSELYFSVFALFDVFRPLIVTLVLASLVAFSDSPSPVPAAKFFLIIVTSLCEFQVVQVDLLSPDHRIYHQFGKKSLFIQWTWPSHCCHWCQRWRCTHKNPLRSIIVALVILSPHITPRTCLRHGDGSIQKSSLIRLTSSPIKGHTVGEWSHTSDRRCVWCSM